MPNYSGVWTLQQQLQAKGANNWPVAPLVIGQAYEGGFYAGQISTTGNGVATHNLVVAPAASGDVARQWRVSLGSTPGTASVIDGPDNTANMDNSTHPAAQFCAGLVTGGYSDWYMPAKNELEVCYYNLKPGTTSNNTSSGANTNAVPSRGSNYTTGTPAQTSASNFQTTGAEDFVETIYWTSTQNPSNSNYALVQYFSNGFQTISVKYNSWRVRAVRRVAV
jgi:hypothetical protein